MKYLIALGLILGLCACSQSPFAPSGAGDAFTVPPMLAPVLAAIDQDPWIHPLIGEPMGPWVRRNLAGIVLDASLPVEIGARFSHDTHWVHWNPRNMPETHGIVELASVLLHEARHGQGYRHDCNGHDRSMDDGGAFADQILYLEHQHRLALAAQWRRDYIGCH